MSANDRPADFWEPRSCFLAPIEELEEAVDLLMQAADALLAGDLDSARRHASAANKAEIHAFAHSVMGPTRVEIHRYRAVGRKNAPSNRADARMPSLTVRNQVFARDGWRCRFCGSRVIVPEARKAMQSMLPDVVVWHGPDRQRHAAFYALSAVVDHVVPHAAGGDSEPDNLVTTCQPCNYGRNDWLLEEVGLLDPRLRPPMVDEWDGLRRLLTRKWPPVD